MRIPHPLGVVRCASFSDLAPITMSRRCLCSCSRLRAAPLQLCTTAPLDIHLHTTISQPVDDAFYPMYPPNEL